MKTCYVKFYRRVLRGNTNIISDAPKVINNYFFSLDIWVLLKLHFKIEGRISISSNSEDEQECNKDDGATNKTGLSPRKVEIGYPLVDLKVYFTKFLIGLIMFY